MYVSMVNDEEPLPTNSCTEKSLHRGAFKRSFFIIEKPLHGETFTHTHRRVYTEKLLRKETFTQMIFRNKCVCTEKLFHTETVAHRSFYREKFSPKKTTQKPLRKETFTQRHFYTQKLQKGLQREPFTQRYLYAAFTQNTFCDVAKS